MNPTSVASNFSVQKISAHHYLIRGDNGVADYMKFCDTKWSKTYGGWIVHENEEVDLLQMHMEVLDSLKTTRKELSKEKSKKAIVNKRHTKDNKKKDTKKKDTKKKESKYTRMKRGEDISDDEEDDDDYIPSTEPSSEDSEDEETSDESDESEDIEETSDEEEEEETSDEEEEETDKTRKKEYQFYKKEILAYGYMTERQQEKLDAIWNKILKGWLVPKSYLEKLQKYGWVEVDDVEEGKPKKESEKKAVVHTPLVDKKEVVHTPMVKKKVVQEEPKTFENYKNMLLAKGKMTLVESANIQAIFHPGMKAYLVFPEFKTQLVELGFKDITPVQEKEVKVVKISFTEGDKLDIKNIDK